MYIIYMYINKWDLANFGKYMQISFEGAPQCHPHQGQKM